MKYVFFINMGGAENLQDCDVFLKNMFSDEYI
ncbi:MAG TPA: ferrochelatase, partial [Campylobacter avium]|nr:ferrochelatase [Campylobacter avium]